MGNDIAMSDNVLEQHLAAENSHDVDEITRTFAEDGVLVLNGERFQGRALIHKVHERFGFGNKGAFSELQVRETHRHTTPGTIILEEELSGRHTGSWEGLGPTGRTFVVAVCTVYQFNETGELASERAYFDGNAILKQLRAPLVAKS